jgi:ABC-type nickel/cobalt efflux system permease component RcnA
MRKKDTAKKVEAKSCLTVSDWVTFLSNERQGMMSNVVNFSVFLVAAITLILVASGHIAFATVSAIIVFGSAGWVYFRVLGPIRQRGYLADEILKGIISGELKDADSIRGEWALGLAVIRRGWFLRQGRARLAVLKRAWRYEGKPRLVALKETLQSKWEAGLAAIRETRRQEKARLVALKETSQHKWEAGLAALRQTWYQEKARLATLAQTWRLW